MYWQEQKRPYPLKIQILGFIAQQGIVSLEDINRHFYPDRDNTKAIRVTLYDMGVSHLRYYSPGIKNGVWYIGKQDLYNYLGTWYEEIFYMRVREPLVHLIPHYLELNRIRTAFERDSDWDVDQWLSESLLRAMPVYVREEYCSFKIPDAIFWHKRLDGTRKKFFLEFERSFKNTKRYVEIFRSYSKREDVQDGNVIYICHTPQIRNKLISTMKKESRSGILDCTSDYFQFLSLEKFYQWCAEAKTKRKSFNSKPEVKPVAKVEEMQAL